MTSEPIFGSPLESNQFSDPPKLQTNSRQLSEFYVPICYGTPYQLRLWNSRPILIGSPGTSYQFSVHGTPDQISVHLWNSIPIFHLWSTNFRWNSRPIFGPPMELWTYISVLWNFFYGTPYQLHGTNFRSTSEIRDSYWNKRLFILRNSTVINVHLSHKQGKNYRGGGVGP